MLRRLRERVIPSWQNALLALLAAGLLTLAFPDFEFWFLAWFALVPLMWAVEREGGVLRSFVVGWLFGTAYFFGTCWWLTYAPIHYAAMPWPLAYSLIFIACLGAGVFPGVFAAILSVLLKRFGSWALLAAPFVWVFSEFARYWLTGNNWNAVGYSQAFNGLEGLMVLRVAEFGGVLLSSFYVCLFSTLICLALVIVVRFTNRGPRERVAIAVLLVFSIPYVCGQLIFFAFLSLPRNSGMYRPVAHLSAVQPNVPMKGLNLPLWENLRQRQVQLAAQQVEEIRSRDSWEQLPVLVVLPESPMNFLYNDDRDFQEFTRDFTTRNNVSLLFNSSEPDIRTGRYFNSAVMIGSDGNKIAQYDKVFLLPFGEAVPSPFDKVMPAFVGSFSYGGEYDLLPVGEAKAGVMICFESHFGQLGREYVRNGADVIIEMTNDGYLGPTPVLRQHLANAVFRAVETNRPVLRVTNVGITTEINMFGYVSEPSPTYTEASQGWTVSKSDGSQTLYVRYGDWFAWLCTAVTVGLLIVSFRRRKSPTATNL